MSRKTNNLKKMKEMKKRRRLLRESAAQTEAGILGYGKEQGNDAPGSKRTETGFGVVHVDKFTGEVREGGLELVDELFCNLAREREMFLSSDNPCYLIGRVKQNEAAFDGDEIRRMVDATFECTCHGSPDAWYPNQYALALVHAIPEKAATEVAYFLGNFELGLRTSGERATRHRSQGDWLKESRQLAVRLGAYDALEELNIEDFRNITTHVAGHPRFAEAMSWYERGSGKKMQCGNGSGKQGGAENPMDIGKIIRDMEMAATGVLGTLVIQRSDVESLNLAPYLTPLLSMLKDRDAVIRRRQDVVTSICGYGSDPRELYQIPEVRTFLSLMDQQFPHWFYFMKPGCGFLSILMRCLCPLQSVSFSADHSTATAAISGKDIHTFLERHFSALDAILDRFHLDDANDTLNKKMTEQVLKALRLPPSWKSWSGSKEQ